MRKIFSILETTVAPDCSAELKQLKDKEAEKIKSEEKLKKSNSKLKDFSDGLVNLRSDLMSQGKTRGLNASLALDVLETEFSNGCLGRVPDERGNFPVLSKSAYCLSLRDQYGKCITEVLKSGKVIDQLNYSIPIFEETIKNLRITNTDLVAGFSIAEKEYNDANNAWKKCAGIPSLNFNLKSNLSCKQIKQKIKTVNQKIISLNRKSLGLKYGINSLPILNINKKFSDENIKRTKELIVKLDKLNPIIFSSEKLKSKKLNNITSDSSFYDIYKKAKDDLDSYKTEGKALEAKIKNLKEKTIKDKKIRLEAKFSKLIKKLKTC
jgi:hypothetical protein